MSKFSIMQHPIRYTMLLLLFAILNISEVHAQYNPMLQNKNTEVKTESTNSFVDESLEDKSLLEAQLSNQTNHNSFHLFSHGQPGQLLINNQWLSHDALAAFIQPLLQDKNHLNIYGCHFAQGEKGKAAISYLETALGVSIAASDDLTGVDGDWDLEVGNFKNGVTIQEYSHNLQQGTLPIQPGMAATTCGSGIQTNLYNSDPNGYVFGIYDIREPGCAGTPGANAPNAPANWDGASGSNAYHDSRWTNTNLGEVFGVDLEYDQASSPDIFLSSSGLSVEHNSDQYPMAGGTGGEVFRIDGTTGDITVLATLPSTVFTSATNRDKFTGLGNLSYNADQQKVYATNLDDGNIYVVDATTTGVIDQTYNPTPDIPYAEHAEAYYYTTRARMVYGIEYNKCDKRLYFARPNTLTTVDILSVGLNADGTIDASAPTLETTVAVETNVVISDIEFSDDCTQMLTSERKLIVQTTSNVFLLQTEPHFSEVKRHDLSGGTWSLAAASYSIGNCPISICTTTDTNAGGGVSFGYSNYGACGTDNACADAMVATSDALVLSNGLNIYGLQISDIDGTSSGLTNSYFVDLDGNTGSGENADKSTSYDVDVFGVNDCSVVSCSIDTDGLASVSCTGTNAIRFSLTPMGTGVDGTYNVSVSGGGATSISPTSGNYDEETIFTLNNSSAGGGDVTVTLTDVTESSCTRNVTVTDPGACTYSLGNQVFTDTDNSGDLNGGETGIDGIALQLLNSDGSVYDSDPNTGGDQALTVTTANGGYYRFDDLPAGDYIVEVVASNFAATSILENLVSSTGAAQEADPNSDMDINDNGLDTQVSGATRSAVVTLGTPEPTGEAEPGTYDASSTTGTAAADLFNNLTVDFGFSGVCDLSITQNVQSTCNDNSTIADVSDDYFTIEINASIINGGTQYEVVLDANPDGTGGTVLATSNYDSAVTVGSASTFDADGTTTYAITVRDATDNTCHQDFTTTTLAACSSCPTSICLPATITIKTKD